MLIFVVNIHPARTFWNSTHCLPSPFTLDWSWNLKHNLMWNMAVNNISYPIYPLSTRTEKGSITKMISFFFCSVYFQRGQFEFVSGIQYLNTESVKLYCHYFVHKRKSKRSDSVLWQTPLHSQKNPKSNEATYKRHQILRRTKRYWCFILLSLKYINENSNPLQHEFPLSNKGRALCKVQNITWKVDYPDECYYGQVCLMLWGWLGLEVL